MTQALQPAPSGSASAPIALEDIQNAVPKHLKRNVTQAMVDDLNSMGLDPMFCEQYRENLIGFTTVLKDGKYKMQSYIDAVRYVSFKLMGHTNIDAYKKTFPQRFSYFIANGTSDKDIASYVTAYNKNKLVQGILEQSMIPAYVYNQDVFQEAIIEQAKIMRDPKVPARDRAFAANSLLTHLKQPEKTKIELDVNTGQNDAIADLNQTMQQLAAQQRAAVASGQQDAQGLAHQPLIINGEVAKDVN